MSRAPTDWGQPRAVFQSSRAYLLILSYNDRRVLVPRPISYGDAIWAARTQFNLPFATLILETSDCFICEGELIEISEASWGIIQDELKTVVICVQKEDEAVALAEQTISWQTPHSGRHQYYQIYVKTLTGVVYIKCAPSDTIHSIKVKVEDAEGVPPDGQRFIYGGKQLEDNKTVAYYGIREGHMLHMILRLAGGKPVIYLQAPSEIHAIVNLSLVPSWQFSAVYPMVPVKPLGCAQGESISWSVTTQSDGSLLDQDTNTEVAYLYWEALTNGNALGSPPPSPIHGSRAEVFDPAYPTLTAEDCVILCVRKNLASYLEHTLQQLGLHTEARTSFITYWLPSFLKHEHIALRFVNQDAYERAAPLNVTPKPDIVTRIFMLFKGVTQEELESQGWNRALDKAEEDTSLWQDIVGIDVNRANDASLFRVLEWGGMEVL